MNCRQCQDAIERRAVEALTPALHQDVDAHIIECPTCQAYVQQTDELLSIARASRVPRQSEDYWETFYDKIESRIATEDQLQNEPGVVAKWIASLGSLIPVRQPAMQFALAAAVLVIGILIGKVLFADETATSNPEVATQEDTTGNESRLMNASLDQRTDRFLDRSKVLLLGMVNMDLDETSSSEVDLGKTRLVASELVKESGPLRSDLASADQQRLNKLVEDLEVILLQIANLEENVDIPAIEMVKDGVDKRAVLLKINVSEMRSDNGSRN